MDWKQGLARLAAAGHTQVRIAELCGVSQSTISDLNRGATKSPSFELGMRLQKLIDELPLASDADSAPPAAIEEPAVAGQGAAA